MKNISVGDKIKLKRDLNMFGNTGTICNVINMYNDIITFATSDDGESARIGFMDYDTLNTYFEVYKEKEEELPSITIEHVENILKESSINTCTVFDKCTIVSVRLPNGFVITESSACVCPENYNEKIGFDICMNKIKDKIFELEGYKLQCELYEDSKNKDVWRIEYDEGTDPSWFM